jgi:hypothetical protein
MGAPVTADPPDPFMEKVKVAVEAEVEVPVATCLKCGRKSSAVALPTTEAALQEFRRSSTPPDVKGWTRIILLGERRTFGTMFERDALLCPDCGARAWDGVKP